MGKLYISAYHADGSLMSRHLITGIKRRPPGYIKTALQFYLDDGTSVVFKDISTAKRLIERE